MQIEIIAVVTEAKKNSRGGIYNEAVVTFKNKSFQDKIETKKLIDFAAKEVYPTISQAKFGEVYDILRTKDEQGYWQWTGIAGADAVVPQPQPQGNPMTPTKATPTPTPRSTYETPEERAARQVMIVRQSSIANAIALLAANGGKKNTTDEVVAIAKQFEAYVLGTEKPLETGNPFQAFPEDDVPI